MGFKKFVNLLDPKYVLPSKTTLRDTIQKKLYLEGVNKLKDILNNIEFLAITSDCWTSLASESYISVTCHFIDENFQLKNAILHTKKLDSRHTGENMANALSEIFTEWNIQKKISCIVTDNAANALKMCQILKIKNLPCFAHSLNLVVQDNLDMPVVKDTIKKCKEIVTFIKNSNIAADTFQKEQETCDKQYKLIQEVKTRWNSTLYMLKRIVDTADALNRTLLKSKKAPSPITAEEMIILKDLIKCLDIFEDATNKVSGATYVTVSLIIPITFGIYCNLTDLVKNLSSEEGKSFGLSLIESVKQRLFPYETRTIPRIATILDPRFKKEGFRSTENANQAAIFMEQEMNSMMKSIPIQEKTGREETAAKKSLFSFIDQKIDEKVKSAQADVIIRKRQYLERGNSPQETDPLLVWKVILLFKK